jgi:hypothetical protein
MLLTLLPYLTVALNLIFVLGVLFSISQRVHQLRGRTGKHEAALQSETARLSAEIAELKTKVQVLELEEPTSSLLPAPAAALTSGVNSTLRSKVLKMHRLGQSAERIAGSLRLPQGEVDLLVKVHKIVMRPYEEVVLAPLGAEKV